MSVFDQGVIIFMPTSLFSPAYSLCLQEDCDVVVNTQVHVLLKTLHPVSLSDSLTQI